MGGGLINYGVYSRAEGKTPEHLGFEYTDVIPCGAWVYLGHTLLVTDLPHRPVCGAIVFKLTWGNYSWVQLHLHLQDLGRFFRDAWWSLISSRDYVYLRAEVLFPINPC